MSASSPYGFQVGGLYYWNTGSTQGTHRVRFDGITADGEHQVTFLDGDQVTRCVAPHHLFTEEFKNGDKQTAKTPPPRSGSITPRTKKPTKGKKKK